MKYPAQFPINMLKICALLPLKRTLKTKEQKDLCWEVTSFDCLDPNATETGPSMQYGELPDKKTMAPKGCYTNKVLHIIFATQYGR